MSDRALNNSFNRVNSILSECCRLHKFMVVFVNVFHADRDMHNNVCDPEIRIKNKEICHAIYKEIFPGVWMCFVIAVER
jgi:hypothetical protein